VEKCRKHVGHATRAYRNTLERPFHWVSSICLYIGFHDEWVDRILWRSCPRTDRALILYLSLTDPVKFLPEECGEITTWLSTSILLLPSWVLNCCITRRHPWTIPRWSGRDHTTSITSSSISYPVRSCYRSVHPLSGDSVWVGVLDRCMSPFPRLGALSPTNLCGGRDILPPTSQPIGVLPLPLLGHGACLRFISVTSAPHCVRWSLLR